MGKGQQPGFSFEQPTHGYSRTPPPATVTEAMCGVVQDPFKSRPPVNSAMGPPFAAVNADSISLIVETVAMVKEFMDVWVACAVVKPTSLVVVLYDAVTWRGEHPRKSGILTL